MLGVFRFAADVLLWMLLACMFFVVVSVFAVEFSCAIRGTIRLCFCDVGGLLFWWVGLCCVLIHGSRPWLVSRHGVGASDLVVFVLMGFGIFGIVCLMFGYRLQCVFRACCASLE